MDEIRGNLDDSIGQCLVDSKLARVSTVDLGLPVMLRGSERVMSPPIIYPSCHCRC